MAVRKYHCHPQGSLRIRFALQGLCVALIAQVLAVVAPPHMPLAPWDKVPVNGYEVVKVHGNLHPMMPP